MYMYKAIEATIHLHTNIHTTCKCNIMLLLLTAAVSLRYLRKSPSWMSGILDGGREALGMKYIPHVRVKRSYSRFTGSFSAAARFCAGEDMVQFGPSDFSPTSFTLGMRGRVECGGGWIRLFFLESYLPSSSSSWVRNTSPSSLFSAAIPSCLHLRYRTMK